MNPKHATIFYSRMKFYGLLIAIFIPFLNAKAQDEWNADPGIRYMKASERGTTVQRVTFPNKYHYCRRSTSTKRF